MIPIYMVSHKVDGYYFCVPPIQLVADYSVDSYEAHTG